MSSQVWSRIEAKNKVRFVCCSLSFIVDEHASFTLETKLCSNKYLLIDAVVTDGVETISCTAASLLPRSVDTNPQFCFKQRYLRFNAYWMIFTYPFTLSSSLRLRCKVSRSSSKVGCSSSFIDDNNSTDNSVSSSANECLNRESSWAA